MSQHVQELIDKIKSEGVQAAEDKAKEIENQAEAKKQDIIAEAKNQANQIVLEANQEAEKIKHSTEMALKQSSRDMLLSLRKEIENILQKVISIEVKGSLTSENLASILENVIKAFFKNNSNDEDVFVSLSEDDLKQIKDGFIEKLQTQLKKEIKLQSSNDIEKGFSISFDEGKSAFDFTDVSLAGYLSGYLNEYVSSLIKESL